MYNVYVCFPLAIVLINKVFIIINQNEDACTDTRNFILLKMASDLFFLVYANDLHLERDKGFYLLILLNTISYIFFRSILFFGIYQV